MIFDSRIKSEDDIFHYFNRKNAAQFIGKRGYFADDLSVFKENKSFHNFESMMFFNNVEKGILSEINNDYESCYFFEGNRFGFKYFIPEEFLKKSLIMVPKYRAFTNEEFLNLFDSGKLHSIRHGGKQGRYIITCVYFDCEQNSVFVNLNHSDVGLDMRYLFRKGYEYFDGKEWHPFGVEDKNELTELKEI